MSKKVQKRNISFNECKSQNHSLPVGCIKRAELLLPYKSYMRKQNKGIFLKEIDIKIQDRYKNRNTQVIKKNYEVNDALYRIEAVNDLDEEYFKIVNGRPLAQYIPLYKSLKNIWNRRLRLVQEIGYKKDSTLNIETNFRLEKKVYDLSLKRFTEQAKAFDKFILEDYQKSMNLLEEGEILTAKLDAKVCELQNLADQSFTIISRLIGLDYKYGLQQKYGRFLYYLSPPMWRSSNREFAKSIEIEAKGFDFGGSNDDDNFILIFEKMRKECSSSFVHPVLYFLHPSNLVDVFSGIETQQLSHFRRQQQLAPHKKRLEDGIRILKEKIAQDSAAVTASIKDFKNLLSFSEERCAQLKKRFFKILNGYFYENVGTIEVLKFILHLEFCYDKVFVEKSMNMDMVTMAKAIESMYLNYTRRLDEIQSKTVQNAMKKCIELENRKIDKAKCAAKELRLFHRLEKELLRAHGIPYQEVNNECTVINLQNSKRYLSKSRVCKITSKTLTDAELEYLTLFTDWTWNEDPALYLQSLNTDSI